MSSPAASAPFTWDDFVALEEDDLRELIDGELVEVEVPTGRHEQIVMWLGYFLLAWAEAGHGGRVLGSGYKVVEITSPSSQRYDRVTKLRWYAQLGVPEYWLVDGNARTLERLVLREGVYAITASLADDETFRPESLEGLEIPLAKLWA